MRTFRSGGIYERDACLTVIRSGLLGICALIAAGCGSDSTAPVATPTVWRVQLNHHAVTLATVAPYDTIRLVATPIDANGAPLPSSGRTVFTTSDTSITIDSTGLVHVHRTGSDALGITVTATLSLGRGGTSITLADTAVFNVVSFASAADVPRLDSLHLRPVGADSARRAVVDTSGNFGTQTLDSAVATTSTGAIIPNVVVWYRSSDSLIASFTASTTLSPEAPQITANAPGVVVLTAEATVYGRPMTDSLVYTAGYPLRVICSYGYGELIINLGAGATFQAGNHLSLGQLAIGQGGAVLWGNSLNGLTQDSLDIQFDRTTGIAGLTAATQFPGFFGAIEIPAGPGGNIPAFPPALLQHFGGLVMLQFDSVTSKARVFTQPGMYHWSSQRQGITGTVTVISNDSLRRK